MNILNGAATTAIRRKTNEIVNYLNSYLPNGAAAVDSIAEKTTGAGVTVDGMLIKDGAVFPGTSKVTTKMIEVAITSAEIKTLNTSPKILVAAPGAGFALNFIRAVLIYDSTATAYTSGGVITVNYGSGGAACSANLAATFLTGAGDKVWNLEKLNGAGGFTMPVNTTLVLTCASADFATGTGVCRLQIEYSVHETGL